MKEFKRKYPQDYFKAVNRREKRFKEQLYHFFPQEKIIKIIENIEIKTDKGNTDIDAILYDKEENILALFQLKWQDPFYNSMTERFSRITNLIPKSIEWIDKIVSLLSNNSVKSILKTLKINVDVNELDDVFIFVLSREHVNFTNQKLDKRAIWASWYQIFSTLPADSNN